MRFFEKFCGLEDEDVLAVLVKAQEPPALCLTQDFVEGNAVHAQQVGHFAVGHVPPGTQGLRARHNARSQELADAGHLGF